MRRLLSLLLLCLTMSAPATASAKTPRTLLLGDSLAVGIAGALQSGIGKLHTDARVGRPLAEGMSRLGAYRRRPVLAVSLFTNDDPRRVASLKWAVGRAMRWTGPRGCVVWATVRRPPLAGVNYSAANRLLARTAKKHPNRFELVRWNRAVREHPHWMGTDGVHPTPAGYAARARMYERAIRACRR